MLAKKIPITEIKILCHCVGRGIKRRFNQKLLVQIKEQVYFSKQIAKSTIKRKVNPKPQCRWLQKNVIYIWKP